MYEIAFTRETVLKQLVFTCLFSLHLSVYFTTNFRQRYTVTLFSKSDILVAVPEHRAGDFMPGD